MTFQPTSIDSELTRLRRELENMTEERDYWKDIAEERGTLEQRIKIRQAFDLTPAESMLLAALYARQGKVVRHDEIDDVAPPLDHARDRDRHVGIVWVCRLRKKIGRDAIAAVWGEGHYLTPTGIDRVTAALA